MSKPKKTSFSQEELNAIALVAGKAGAKAAVEEIRKEQQREKESRYDRRLGNTRLLLSLTGNTSISWHISTTTISHSLPSMAGKTATSAARTRGPQGNGPGAKKTVGGKSTTLTPPS